MLASGTAVDWSANAEFVVCSEELSSSVVGSLDAAGAPVGVGVPAFSVLASVATVDVSALGEAVVCLGELSVFVDDCFDMVDSSVEPAVTES